MSETQRYYDLTAQSTADEWYGNESLLPTLRDFMTVLPEHPRLLDLGCGPGHEAMRLHALGADVVGIDFSSQCIRIAAERNPSCAFFEMDFLALDGSLGVFDGALAAGSLIHVQPDKMPGLLSRIRAVLRPRGVLCAVVRDGAGELVSHPVVNGIELERTVHLYRREDIAGIGGAAGLEFLREGILDEAIHHAGWRCYLLQRCCLQG